MEEVQPLTEDLRLMIHFDPEALTGVQTAEALLQLLLDIVRVPSVPMMMRQTPAGSLPLGA
jgi:hypothetical protein